MIEYGSHDFQIHFPSDTLDMSATETAEPKDGFWLYEKGKNPIVIYDSESLIEIIDKAKTYFESVPD